MKVLSAALLATAMGCGAPEETADEDLATPTASHDEPGAPPTEGGEADPPADAPPETTGVALEAQMQAILEAHNRLRAAHCAPPLSWSLELAEHARVWADRLAERGCNLAHSSSAYGENLAGASAGTLSAEGVAELWYGERAHYDFRRGGFSMRTGHFTQLVWVGTERIGCATTTCGGLDLWVCNYDPPGNVRGEYRTNVLPESCQREGG